MLIPQPILAASYVEIGLGESGGAQKMIIANRGEKCDLERNYVSNQPDNQRRRRDWTVTMFWNEDVDEMNRRNVLRIQESPLTASCAPAALSSR